MPLYNSMTHFYVSSILEEVRPPKNNSSSEIINPKTDDNTDLFSKAKTSLLDIIKKRRNESNVIDSAKRYEAEDTPNIIITENIIKE